jgi:hypothetical protein
MSVTWKQFCLAIAVVFVTQAAVSGVLYLLAVEPFVQTPAFFRAEGGEHLALYIISRVIFSAVFVYLFSVFARAPGVIRGVRFGVTIWLLYSIPMTIGFWAFVKLPDLMAIGWIVVGLGEFVSSGAMLGLTLRRLVPS